MIELENINKNYGKNKILNNLNLSLPDNGLFVISGKNGVGKTTLLYIIGLLDFDFGGNLYIDNINVKKADINYLREYRNRNISYIFSKGNLIPYLNVKDNLEIGIENKDDIIKFIDLPDKQDVRTLSGGEELLLSLSHEVSLKKKIYLLDEVTSALDDDNLKKLMEILKQLSEKCLIVLVAHDERVRKVDEKLIFTIK